MYEGKQIDEARSYLSGVTETPLSEANPRAYEMARLYATGSTLDEIGQQYSVSRERVRQIINASTPWSVPDIKTARRVVRDFELREQAERDVERVLEWSHSHPGEPISAAVQELGMPREFVFRVLGSRRSLHMEASRADGSRKVWEDEELLELIRTFHEETGLTTSMSFEQWSVAQGGPTRQTPTNRFGSWARAVELAGVDGVRGIERKRRYSAEDLWATVIEFYSTERESYCFQAYSEWLEATEGAPSASLVRSHLQVSWSRMARVALEVVHNCGEGHDPEWVKNVRVKRDWSTFVDDTEPLEHVKEAIVELGEYLTCISYRDWARKNGRPQVLTLMNRTGLTWTELVNAAGGRAGDRTAERISDEEMFQAFDDFLETDDRLRYEAYNRWASQHGRPRAGTISTRFNGWRLGVAKYRESRGITV